MRVRSFRRLGATSVAQRVSWRWRDRVAAVFAAILTIAGCGGGGGSGIPVSFSLLVEVRTPSQENLTWTPHPGGVTNYQVHRNGALAFTTSSPGSPLMDFNLDPDTQYCYIVYAVVFPLGSVGRSNEVCARTLTTAPWRLETIDGAAASAGSNSLINDAADKLHVSYRRSDGIVYATNSSGPWISTVIAGISGAFDDPAIALDTAGAVHVSYNDPGSGVLKHATNASGFWVDSSIDTTGFGSAIVVDSSNKIHVSYAENGPFGRFLSYALNQTGTWTPEFVSGAGGVSDTALAVDSAGTAHIAYVAGSGLCAVRYATKASGSWVDTLIASNAGCAAAIVLDVTGIAHIVYMQSFDLMYATNASGAWVTISVDQLDWIGFPDVSITRDSSGALHVSYQDQNADLKYATNASGVWATFYIDARGSVGAGNAVRVNSDGSVHIAYFDTTNTQLKHATDR